MELLLSICLGVGLSAASGFRIFVPALIANVAAMNDVITPTEGFAWLASWPTFIVLLSATIMEIMAYYVPFVDNLLDTVAVPFSVVAGTILTTSFLPIENEAWQWGLGLIAGGGTAGLMQAGTSAVRLLSTKTTAGIANPVVSTTENVAAFSISSLAIFLPVLAFFIVITIVVWLVSKFIHLKRSN